MSRLALEMGKDLFAVPGHPVDEHFTGTNNLIKQGCAYLLTCLDDILQQIELPATEKIKVDTKKIKDLFEIAEEVEELEIPNHETNNTLEGLIKNNPMTIDEIVRYLQVPLADVTTQITMLELQGKLKRLEGGAVELL